MLLLHVPFPPPFTKILHFTMNAMTFCLTELLLFSCMKFPSPSSWKLAQGLPPLWHVRPSLPYLTIFIWKVLHCTHRACHATIMALSILHCSLWFTCLSLPLDDKLLNGTGNFPFNLISLVSCYSAWHTGDPLSKWVNESTVSASSWEHTQADLLEDCERPWKRTKPFLDLMPDRWSQLVLFLLY